MALSVPLFALVRAGALGREVSIVAISETVLVLAGGTAVLSIPAVKEQRHEVERLACFPPRLGNELARYGSSY